MEDYIYHEETYKGYTIKIIQDTDPMSPLDWEQLGVIYSNCRDFNPYKCGIDEILVEEEDGEMHIDPDYIFLRVYAYIHSGIALSTSRGGQFSDPWDSRLAGIIAVHKDKVEREYGDLTISTLEKVYKVLEGEVETWNDYLQGNVWGYKIENKDGDSEESVWGYYGDPMDYCLSEAKNSVDCFVEQAEKEAQRIARMEAAVEPFWID